MCGVLETKIEFHDRNLFRIRIFGCAPVLSRFFACREVNFVVSYGSAYAMFPDTCDVIGIGAMIVRGVTFGLQFLQACIHLALLMPRSK